MHVMVDVRSDFHLVHLPYADMFSEKYGKNFSAIELRMR